MVHYVKNPELLNRFIPACLVSARNVLDVGAGIRPQKLVKAKYHECIEPHGEYADVLRKMGKTVIQEPAQSAMRREGSLSIDTVIMLDFVEHLPKAEAQQVIRDAVRIAYKQVVVLTPLGYMPQTCSADAPDPWGLHGNVWQEHRSAWSTDDFKGWEVYVCQNFHTTSYQGDHQVKLDQPMGAIWAVYTKWENCSAWDKLKAKHRFSVLWAIALTTQGPQIASALLLMLRHKLVVTFRVKQILGIEENIRT